MKKTKTSSSNWLFFATKQVKQLCFILVCYGLFVCGCGSEAPQATRKALPTLASDVQGPFGVGVVTRSVAATHADKGNGARTDVEIWYPIAKNKAYLAKTAGRTIFDGLAGIALRNAAPLLGYQHFPLVVFSHGLAGVRDQNPFQVQFLASRGYIVISADHPPSTLLEVVSLDANAEAMISAVRRPFEVVAQIDAAETWNADKQDIFYDLIDSRKVVVIGHSFGGYSAFAVSGARGSINSFIEACNSDPNLDESFQCDLGREFAATSPKVQQDRLVDPRIVGVIPMTPGATPAFKDGFKDVVVPVLMWGGEIDDVAEPELFQDWVYDKLPKPRMYARVPGAGHLDFSQLCLSGLPLKCGTGKPMTPLQITTMINDLTAAFVDWLVFGRQDAADRLRQEAVLKRWPLLHYQAEF